ncbi:hypothetical protein K8I61_13930 [bacterium]|nr:hypothetical protein [bacterium]
MRRLRNCDGVSNPAYRVVAGGEVLTRCPVACVSPLSNAILRTHRRAAIFGAASLGEIGAMPELLAQGLEALAGAGDKV